MINSPKPNRSETQAGIVFFLLWLFVLPTLVTSLNGLLPKPLSSGMLNFLFYLISFFIAATVFQKFLRQSAQIFLCKPLRALGCAAAGFAVNFAAVQILNGLLSAFVPDFSNYNDQSVRNALLDTPVFMTLGVVLLVPITEETLFRGLVFRGLYERSPAGAYLASMAAFALVHVMGYIHSADPIFLLISFLQYLPAGLCLCLACRFGGTVVSPIILHAAINAAAVLSVR